MLQSLERRRRPIGVGLVAYGIVGIAAGILVLVATFAAASGLEPAVASVDRQRDAIVATLEQSTAALDRTATVLDTAADGATNAAGIGSQAADATRLFAATLTRLADTFGSFSVLGNQPFGPLAADADQIAAQLQGIAANLDGLGVTVGTIGQSLPPLADDVRAIADELATLQAELAAFGLTDAAVSALRWLVVGVALLAAWLLAPAIAALAVGIALLRRPPPTASAA